MWLVCLGMMGDMDRKYQWQSVFDTLLNSMDFGWRGIDNGVEKEEDKGGNGWPNMFCTNRFGYSIFGMYQPCVVQ